jgi:hypothetical protein
MAVCDGVPLAICWSKSRKWPLYCGLGCNM